MRVGVYSDGRSINLDERTGEYDVDGVRVTPSAVATYDRERKIAWDSLEYRDKAVAAGGIDSQSGAATATAPKKAQQSGFVYGCLVILVGLGLCGLLSTCNGGSNDGPKVDSAVLQSKVEAASSLKDTFTGLQAQDDGTVIITLNMTKEALGGSGGINEARRLAGGAAGEILSKVPEVSTVTIFDANNKIIDIYERN